MPPSSAKAKHASSAMPMPTAQTVRKSHGCRVLMATSLAVRKMPEPMMPPASNKMESVSESPRTSLASLGNIRSARKLRLRYNLVFGGVVKGGISIAAQNGIPGNFMVIKPLYLLADSQLLFWKTGSDSLAERIRADLDSAKPSAAYIGASNGDQPEFYNLFVGAMESMGISNCRQVASQPSREDILFLENAGLIVLSGGNVEQGWQVFEQNGLKELLPRKRFDGAVLMGVSAGAVQLGLGCLSNAAQPKLLNMFRFAPFYVGAHDESNDWFDLRALVNLSQSDARAIGLPAGGGAVYYADGTLEPLRKPLIEIVKENSNITENLMAPLDPSRQPQG